jgi:hypothetical protein
MATPAAGQAEAGGVLEAAPLAAGLRKGDCADDCRADRADRWVQPLDPADARALAAFVNRALLTVGGLASCARRDSRRPKVWVLCLEAGSAHLPDRGPGREGQPPARPVSRQDHGETRA